MDSMHSLLYRVFHGQRSYLKPYLDSIGLGPGQPRVLSYLAEHGESSQRDVAEFYSIDPGNVSRSVESLLRHGFITQAQCPGNRRANMIAITDEGRKVLKAWHDHGKEVDEVMLDGFSEDERALLSSFLRRIEENYRRGR